MDKTYSEHGEAKFYSIKLKYKQKAMTATVIDRYFYVEYFLTEKQKEKIITILKEESV